jgi:hypothetical protein
VFEGRYLFTFSVEIAAGARPISLAHRGRTPSLARGTHRV